MHKGSRVALLLTVAAAGLTGGAVAGPPTAEQVGDADTFGKPMRWIGLLQTGSLTLSSANCADWSPNGPDDRCVPLNAAGTTNFTFTDLARVTLPGKSAENVICNWTMPYINYTVANPGPAPAQAVFALRATFRIESDVLNDPALINPGTGMPFNGMFDVGLVTYREDQTLAAGAQQSRTIYPSRLCAAGIVSRVNLKLAYGLSEKQVNEFFKKPITIRAGMAGSALNVTQGGIATVSTRLTGD
jgi:hypothetical protein